MSQSRPQPVRVDVWRVTVPEHAPTWLRDVLSPDEQARMQRYRDTSDATRFGVSRAVARSILGEQLRMAPADVPLAAGPAGKPHVTVHPHPPAFNVSHAGALAVCAVTRGSPVGVDIEALADLAVDWDVAARMYSSAEQARLRATSTDAAAALLFGRIWTRKEALVKADGRGLDVPLAQTTVLDQGAVLLGDRSYVLVDFDAGPGHVGALAVAGGAVEVHVRDWHR